jgi:hypothetical protein
MNLMAPGAGEPEIIGSKCRDCKSKKRKVGLLVMRAYCRILVIFLMTGLFLEGQSAMASRHEIDPPFGMGIWKLRMVDYRYSELPTPNYELKISQPEVRNPQSELRPLAASEEEVKRFLDTYIDRYTRKDVDGLLFLFSPRVIQNRQQRLEEIRMAYTSFCDRSDEIGYRLKDVKAEIYENGVEIKAHYELDQLSKKGEKKIWKGPIRWGLVKEDGALKILFLDYQNQ